jgi:hypothetical protein
MAVFPGRTALPALPKMGAGDCRPISLKFKIKIKILKFADCQPLKKLNAIQSINP